MKTFKFNPGTDARRNLPTWQKLPIWAVELAAMKIKVDAAGEFGELYEPAHDILQEMFDILLEVRGGDMLHVPSTICERDGAALRVLDNGLVHIAPDGTATEVEDSHHTEGDLGAIVVAGHQWRWMEMADGAVTTVHDLIVVPHWEQYRAVVADPGMLFRVPASRLVEAGRGLKAVWSAEWADYVCARYLLTPGVER